MVFSPRTWRCFLWGPSFFSHNRSFLHARGDVSCGTKWPTSRTTFSPRTWRCFLHVSHLCQHRPVFSTHVEMFLPPHSSKYALMRFLHARGDVSYKEKETVTTLTFSPRTWRCFFIEQGFVHTACVFSTHVEMFLQRDRSLLSIVGFLHARGDVSQYRLGYYLEA